MKVIESPVKRWPGTVGLRENLFLPQTVAVMDVIEEVGFLDKEEGESFVIHLKDHLTLLPAILDCVEEWDLEGLERPKGPETFPGNPLGDASRLASWLFNEVFDLVLYGDAVPNE